MTSILDHQKKVIDRLSRKIQRLKKTSLSISEINKILYCLDLVFRDYGIDRQAGKIYRRLYFYKKGIIENEKQKIYK